MLGSLSVSLAQHMDPRVTLSPALGAPSAEQSCCLAHNLHAVPPALCGWGLLEAFAM